MSIATDAQPDIASALSDFGTDATFRSIVHGARVIGSGSADVVTETTIKVVPTSYSAHEIGNGVATETDIKIIVAGDAISSPPKIDDEVILLDVTYKIGRVEQTIFQGTRLLYTIKLLGN